MNSGDTTPSQPVGARRITLAGGVPETVVDEAPLFLDIQGTRLLTMRTPAGEQADLDWALGFLATEGVIEDVSELRELSFRAAAPSKQSEDGTIQADEVRVALWRPSGIGRLGTLARTHEMRASCGLCGVASAEALVAGMKPLAAGTPRVSQATALAIIESLRERQPLFAATGGCHGVAIAQPDGTLLAVAEDIGRHNALDRAIGECLRKGVRLGDCVAALSGRSGYEMVVKCLRVGIPVILSVGAASSFSVELAQAAYATLAGFVRRGRGEQVSLRLYADAGRMQG